MAKKVMLQQKKDKGGKIFNPHKFEEDLLKKSGFEEKTIQTPMQRKTTMIIYVGMAHGARRLGTQTGKLYEFIKDGNGKPIPVRVNNLDLPALIQEKGKGCWRVEPSALFILKEEWDKECN